MGLWSIFNSFLYHAWIRDMWISSSPSTICWREFFLHWMVMTSLSKIIWLNMCVFILDSQLVHTVLITGTLLVNFEIRKCDSSRFFWLFEVPCNSIWILELAFPFLQKKERAIGILIRLHWICRLFWRILPLKQYRLQIHKYKMFS